MTRDEAAQLLTIMASPHGWEIGLDTSEVWFHAALERTDYDLGLAAAMRLVETVEKFPTPALFNGTCATVKRERWQAEQAALRAADAAATAAAEPGALPMSGHGVETAAQQRARLVALTREANARSQAKGDHNHRGPNPCPVCGGIRPPKDPR